LQDPVLEQSARDFVESSIDLSEMGKAKNRRQINEEFAEMSTMVITACDREGHDDAAEEVRRLQRYYRQLIDSWEKSKSKAGGNPGKLLLLNAAVLVPRTM